MTNSDFQKKLSARQFPLSWPGHFLATGWHRSGKIEDTGAQRKSLNPGTGELLIATTTEREAKQTLDLAIESAHQARLALRALPLSIRMDELRTIRNGLADNGRHMSLALRLEAGLTPYETELEIASALRHMDHVLKNPAAVEEALLAPARLAIPSVGSHEIFAMLPVGITLGYLPFSTPLSTFAVQTTGAFLAGCPLIAMPSPHGSLVGVLLAEMIAGLNLTNGSLQVVFGNFEVLRHGLLNKKITAVLFNGSREHCDQIRAESRAVEGRQLVLQSGGKNAVIVHDSADIEHAVQSTLAGALRVAGQMCTSTSRVFVPTNQLSDFCEQMQSHVEKLIIGRTDLPDQDHLEGSAALPGKGSPHMGPLYSGKALDKFLRFQTMGRRESRQSLSTGRKITELRNGNFVIPGIHVMKQFEAASSYQSNVLFSPDIAIYEYQNIESAIEAVNATDAAFALAFHGDPEVIQNWRHHILAPNVILNGATTELEAQLPLAGRLQSGHHRFHGVALALYLSYPQVFFQQPEGLKSFIAAF